MCVHTSEKWPETLRNLYVTKPANPPGFLTYRNVTFTLRPSVNARSETLRYKHNVLIHSSRLTFDVRYVTDVNTTYGVKKLIGGRLYINFVYC